MQQIVCNHCHQECVEYVRKHCKTCFNKICDELERPFNEEIYKERKVSKKEMQQIYHKNHPEVSKKHSRIRRARQANVQEHYTEEDELYTRDKFNNKCAVCGSIENLCIDHWLPLSKGNALSRENAVLLCNTCNAKKNNKLPIEMYPVEFVNEINNKLILDYII